MASINLFNPPRIDSSSPAFEYLRAIDEEHVKPLKYPTIFDINLYRLISFRFRLIGGRIQSKTLSLCDPLI